jgi:hypothetical protein
MSVWLVLQGLCSSPSSFTMPITGHSESRCYDRHSANAHVTSSHQIWEDQEKWCHHANSMTLCQKPECYTSSADDTQQLSSHCVI